MKRLAVVTVILVALVGTAGGAERFPPPEFDTGHRIPLTAAPGRHVTFWDSLPGYVDILVLAGALGLAAVLALRTRSRNLILLLTIGSLFYFGFYRKGCICPIGATQNVCEAIFNSAVVVPVAVVLLFLLPLVAALLFGRVFCSSVCPLGAIQDVVLARPVAVPPHVEHALGMVPYIYLGASVLFAATGTIYLICEFDPFVALFRLVDLPALSTSGSVHSLALTGVFIGLSIFIGRPYCRYLCPYGVLLNWLSRVSWRRPMITSKGCVTCSLCGESCPFGAIRVPTETLPGSRRTEGKRRLAVLLLLLPILVGCGAVLGGLLVGPFSRIHPVVQLAERVRLEEVGMVEGTTEASEAFRATGRPMDDLYAEARAVRNGFLGSWRGFELFRSGTKAVMARVFVPGGAVLLGAFVGAVFGLKLIGLSIRRRRTDYEADPGSCLACGRCFIRCPVEQASPANSRT